MFKKIVQLVIVFSLLLANSPVAGATVQGCREQVAVSLESVMQGSTISGVMGYIQQLSNLTSTNTPTYLLIDEVQQMARDAYVEVKGVCEELEKFEAMSEYYTVAYGLDSCRELNTTNSESAGRLEVLQFCQQRSDDLMVAFLGKLRNYLLKQAIRTSEDPLVQRMRSLNERLIVLVGEYSRLVNNFYTFSFRLGDTITGERD